MTRWYRRTGKAVSLAAAALLTLASLGACAPQEVEDTLTVTGEVGAPPVVQFRTPMPVEPTSVEVVTEGSGPPLAAGAPIVLATTSYDGETGEVVDPATAGRPRVLHLTESDLGSDLAGALPGATEGSRLVVTQPVATPGGEGEQDSHDSQDSGSQPSGDSSDQGTAGDGETAEAEAMLVVVVDVLPTRATGEPVEPPADLGLAVGEDAGGAPTITLDQPLVPQDLRIVTLRRGTGAAVVPGQEVTLQYLGIDLTTGETYDTTWAADRGPQVVAVDETFPGLRDALLDQPVGSRVLVIAPAAEAFGDAPLAFVVDVLAAHGGDAERVVRGA